MVMRAWADYQTLQWKYLSDITRAITARLDLDSILGKSLRYAVELVGGESGLIALRAPDDTFQFAARFGIEERLLPRLEPLLTEVPPTLERDEVAGWRFPEFQIRFAGVIDAPTLRLRYAIAIPLVASDRLVGIIYVFRSPQRAAFTAMDEDALESFADHIAIAIEHAWLYHDAERRAKELAAIIEGSAHGILIADREGRIHGINRALEQLTGWSRGDAAGKPYDEVLRLTDPRGGSVEFPSFAGKPRSPFTADGLVIRQDGERGAFVHVTLAPLYEAQELFSIVGNVVDLTAMKEADEVKTTFLAGISHDLKTPLALIRGYAETLRRTDVEWDRKTVDESLGIIEDEADYLTNLVNALLDAAQLERGGLPLRLNETRVDELAKKMVERFQAVHTGHRWAVDFPSDWPAVPADAERIREVLQNLLTNAVKYSPRGGLISVGGWVEPERVGVVVRDEGPGISLEEQGRIFERFTRGRGSVVRRAQGAGLGLYLCRAIVEQHGGKVWLENLPERGAAFYFTLPRESK